MGDPGSCSVDGWHCIPTPTTTTTTTITSTKALKTIGCNADAIVGHCFIAGCFRGHGNAHCHGTECLCDKGSCSMDGWKCITTPNASATFVEQALVQPPELISDVSSYLWIGAAFGATLVAFVYTVATLVARPQEAMAEPL